jgi:hypothetical protein
MDQTDFLERFIATLQKFHIRYCVVGGLAVNAYAEPVVTLDLDIAVAVKDFAHVESLLSSEFAVIDFPHSVNFRRPGAASTGPRSQPPRCGDRGCPSWKDLGRQGPGPRAPLLTAAKVRAVQRSIMDRFRNMAAVDRLRAGKVGDRPRHFQDAVIAARR